MWPKKTLKTSVVEEVFESWLLGKSLSPSVLAVFYQQSVKGGKKPKITSLTDLFLPPQRAATVNDCGPAYRLVCMSI